MWHVTKVCVCGSACKQFGSLNWQTGLSPDLGTWPESTRKCWRAHSGHRVISSLVLHTCRFHIKYAGTPSVRSCCSCRTKVMREPLHPRLVATAGMTVTEIEANEATAIEATEPTEGKVKGHLAYLGIKSKARVLGLPCLDLPAQRKGKGKGSSKSAPPAVESGLAGLLAGPAKFQQVFCCLAESRPSWMQAEGEGMYEHL